MSSLYVGVSCLFHPKGFLWPGVKGEPTLPPPPSAPATTTRTGPAVPPAPMTRSLARVPRTLTPWSRTRPRWIPSITCATTPPVRTSAFVSVCLSGALLRVLALQRRPSTEERWCNFVLCLYFQACFTGVQRESWITRTPAVSSWWVRVMSESGETCHALHITLQLQRGCFSVTSAQLPTPSSMGEMGDMGRLGTWQRRHRSRCILLPHSRSFSMLENGKVLLFSSTLINRERGSTMQLFLCLSTFYPVGPCHPFRPLARWWKRGDWSGVAPPIGGKVTWPPLYSVKV